jgi:hypothetical protein
VDDTSNVRLIVTGVPTEVRAFISQHERLRIRTTHRRGTQLLQACLWSCKRPARIAGQPLLQVSCSDSDDPDPRKWVRAVAPQFPNCCFVLGLIEPEVDSAMSVLVGRGAALTYQIGKRRREQLYRKHHRKWEQWVRRGEVEESGDLDLMADWDADAEMMEILMQRWAASTLRRLR